MNQYSTTPEFTVEQSEKTLLTGNQLAFIVHQLLDLEVDSVVLSKELKDLVGLSERIVILLREARQSLEREQL